MDFRGNHRIRLGFLIEIGLGWIKVCLVLDYSVFWGAFDESKSDLRVWNRKNKVGKGLNRVHTLHNLNMACKVVYRAV